MRRREGKAGSVEALKKANAVLGRHMALLTVCFVAFGILFPAVLEPLAPAVTFLFAIVTFQGALGNTVDNVVRVFRRPRMLLGILVASAVVMPSIARVTGGLLFGGDPDILAGIVLEYCVPVAVVSVMWTNMAHGNTALSLSSVLISTVLAPVVLPLMMKLLMGTIVEVDVMGLMRSTLIMVAIPAVAGIAVNEATHGWGAKTLSPTLAPFCKVLVLFIIGTNSTAISDYMHNLTPELVGVICLIFVLACTGYFLGIGIGRVLGDGPADVATGCLEVGMRNISCGAVIAAQFFPPATMFPVMAGTLFQQVLAAAFSRRLTVGEKDE